MKYFVMGGLVSYVNDIDSSSVGGADDNDDESENDMISDFCCGSCLRGLKCVEAEGCKKSGVGITGRILSTAAITRRGIYLMIIYDIA